MDSEFCELIIKSKAEDSNDYTHVSFYSPQMKLYLRSNEQHNFWTKYCHIASKNISSGKANLDLKIGEKPQSYMPIVVKGSLKFNANANVERYEDDFILAIVYCYQQAILEIFEIDSDQHELLCCVLEPIDAMYVDSFCIYNFALQFPYCKTETIIQ